MVTTDINVKALRAQFELSQTQLAEALGVSQSAVSHWETRGVPKRGATRKLLMSFAHYGKSIYGKDRAA
jgi:DNA-binding transcriptional regulator YiaG